MTAREVDGAAARLESIGARRRGRVIASIVAALLAAGALFASTRLGIALMCGVVCLLLLAVADTLRRRDLIATLALDPHAYAVPEVRRYGASLVLFRRRKRVAASLERVLEDAGRPGAYYLVDRVDKYRREIEAVASALRAPGTRVEPTSVALCSRLLTRAAESPLYNWRVPADDLGVAVRRIQSGIRPEAAEPTT
jgi:hypothetical protein